MGIDPDIGKKETEARRKFIAALHKKVNVGAETDLAKIHRHYDKLSQVVPAETKMAEEQKLYVIFENLGDPVRNPVLEDQDHRVVVESRKRFQRQRKQVGQIKKQVRRRIRDMEKVLRKMSGAEPCTGS